MQFCGREHNFLGFHHVKCTWFSVLSEHKEISSAYKMIITLALIRLLVYNLLHNPYLSSYQENHRAKPKKGALKILHSRVLIIMQLK